MLEQIVQIIESLGVHPQAATIAGLAAAFILVMILAGIAFFIAKKVLLRIASSIIKRTSTAWDDRLLDHRFFFWIAHLAPGIVIYLLTPIALEAAQRLIAAVQGTCQIYMIVVGLLALDSLLNAGLDIYNSYSISRQVHLKSFIQVAKILLYVVALVVILATVLGKSPTYLLSGMGVLASVLMLVFKDPILGFVAGIQLSANQMLSRGDWIEMPSHGADGDVIDIALTTVKVQNWDKTITSIPTYSLISDSFKNWRGMSESGGRRIKRAVHIDMKTIKLCTPEMLERFSKITYIADYIQKKQQEVVSWNRERQVETSDRINARHLTNVGTFRAYVLAYLKNHPRINQNMTLLVRQLAPTGNGLPIEIYCFTNDTRWAYYEDIQADIFDHILAIAQEFDLRVYQNPSGSDFQALAGRT
ncbi:MAG: mechanosensitive ion channel family protein [Acidobacteriota bacterium]